MASQHKTIISKDTFFFKELLNLENSYMLLRRNAIHVPSSLLFFFKLYHGTLKFVKMISPTQYLILTHKEILLC